MRGVQGQGHRAHRRQRQQPGADHAGDQQEGAQDGHARAEADRDGQGGVGVRRVDGERPPGVGGQPVLAPDQDLVQLPRVPRRGGQQPFVAAEAVEQDVRGRLRADRQTQADRQEAQLGRPPPQIEPAEPHAGQQVGQVGERRIGAGQQQLGRRRPRLRQQLPERGVVGDGLGQCVAQRLHEHRSHEQEDRRRAEQRLRARAQEGHGQEEEHAVVDEDVVRRQVVGQQGSDGQSQHRDQHRPHHERHTVRAQLPATVRAGSTGGQGESHARQQREQRRRVPGEEDLRPGRLAGLVVGGRQDVDGHETDERQTAGRVDAGQTPRRLPRGAPAPVRGGSGCPGRPTHDSSRNVGPRPEAARRIPSGASRISTRPGPPWTQGAPRTSVLARKNIRIP